MRRAAVSQWCAVKSITIDRHTPTNRGRHQGMKTLISLVAESRYTFDEFTTIFHHDMGLPSGL